jgi:hypothetical protein
MPVTNVDKDLDALTMGPDGEKHHGWWRIEEVEPPERGKHPAAASPRKPAKSLGQRGTCTSLDFCLCCQQGRLPRP